jgi:hypothetical protein
MVGTKAIDPIEETEADPAPIGGVLAEVEDEDCEEGHLTADGAIDPADAKVNVRHIPDEPEVCSTSLYAFQRAAYSSPLDSTNQQYDSRTAQQRQTGSFVLLPFYSRSLF